MPAKRQPGPAPERTPVCHPYGRISDESQNKGGGLVRQETAPFGEFAARFGFELGKRFYVDDGVSAWDDVNNNLSAELGEFLEEVRRGLIPRGDCLLVENLDRIARHGRRGRHFMDEIQDSGIHVGVLQNGKLYRADSDDLGDVILPMLEFHRGQSESDAKSNRNGSMWEKKRAAARDKRAQPPTPRMGSDAQVLTRMLPAWVRLEGGAPVLIPERVAVVKLIFRLRAAGYGYSGIVQKLTADKVAPFCGRAPVFDEHGKPVLLKKGRRKGKQKYKAAEGMAYGADRWTVPYVNKILNNKTALGEYQPRSGHKPRQPVGPPIPDYYPAAVTPEEFYAAQAGAEPNRKHSTTRRSKHLDVFAGLLTDARSGTAYSAAQKGKDRSRVLVTGASQEGRGPCWSFPVATFETAMLALLKEVNVHEILNGDHAPDVTTVLAAEHAALEASIVALNADLDEHGDSPALFKRLRQKEVRLKEVAELWAAARQKAAHPASESWGEAQALAGLDLTPERRLRLRMALRRIIGDVRLLVVPRGRDRLCCVQVFFADRPVRRTYVILNRAANNGRSHGWWASSRPPGTGGTLDLRQADHVEAMAEELQVLDLEAFIRTAKVSCGLPLDGTPPVG